MPLSFTTECCHLKRTFPTLPVIFAAGRSGSVGQLPCAVNVSGNVCLLNMACAINLHMGSKGSTWHEISDVSLLSVCLSSWSAALMLILSSQIPCVAAKALPMLQLEKGSIAGPPAATGVRGAGLCHPGTLTTLSWHSTAHSHGPFHVPSQLLHLLAPLLEQWLLPFLIHELSQVLPRQLLPLNCFSWLFEQVFHVQAEDLERFTNPAWI